MASHQVPSASETRKLGTVVVCTVLAEVELAGLAGYPAEIVLPPCRLSTLHSGLHFRAVDTAYSSESTSSISINRAVSFQRNDMGGQVWLTALGVSLLTLLGLLLRPWHSVTVPPSVQPAPL